LTAARLPELLKILDLERIEDNLFRGDSRDIGAPQVFGGQVLGQALVAASRTVEGRQVHSLHAYFLRRGDLSVPIVFEVDRSRDGGSFTSRRVVAVQHGQPILTMSASFQSGEPGLDHQAPMPVAPPPESLRDLAEVEAEMIERMPHKVAGYFRNQRPFEFRAVHPPTALQAIDRRRCEDSRSSRDLEDLEVERDGLGSEHRRRNGAGVNGVRRCDEGDAADPMSSEQANGHVEVTRGVRTHPEAVERAVRRILDDESRHPHER
jgi:hypothetical protein